MKENLERKLLPRDPSNLKKKLGVKANSDQQKREKINALRLGPPGKEPRVVSSVYGKIKTMVLFFPTNKGHTVYPYFKFIKELITELKGGGRVFILVLEKHQLSKKKISDLSKSADKNGNCFYPVFIVYNDGNLEPWAQDSFLSITYKVNGSERVYLIEPNLGYKTCNIGYELVQGLKKLKVGVSSFELEHQFSPIPFVGGNVLVADRFVLIGIHGTNKRAIQKLGEEWLGRNIIVLESKSTNLYHYWTQCKMTSDGYCNKYEADVDKQALFHLDLFVTLGGKNEDGQELLVIGDPVVGFSLSDNMSDDIKKIVRQIIMETKKAINEIINQLRVSLRDLRIPFKIIRNPLPLTYYDEITSSSKRRYFSWASYNNCLVESYYTDKGIDAEIVKNIIMPSYGISSDYSSKLDDKTGLACGRWIELHRYDLQNKWIWEDILGYKVLLMREDYNLFARRQGSLNCLTNTIERE